MNSSTNRSYKDLSERELIELAIDFVKVQQPLPSELKNKLSDMQILHLLNPYGEPDETSTD